MTASPGRPKRSAFMRLPFAFVIAALPALPAGGPLLKPGSDLAREIRGGEAHSFQIEIAAGQLLHAVVDQKGVDVAVTLLAPDGREVARSNLPNGDWGPEPIFSIADSSGTYTLNVALPNSKAPPGRYEIRVLDLRDPSAFDRERAAAEVLAAAAEALRQQHTVATRRGAIDKYEQAIQFFEKSGDRYRQGLALNSMGLMYAEAGDMRKALPFYERAIQTLHDVGEKRREAAAINNIGGAYDVLGDPGKARQYYEQALALFRSLNERVLEAIALNNIGKLYYDQAGWQKAIEYYREALPLVRAAGDQRREALELANIGVTFNQLGDPETARDYLQQALELYRASSDNTGRAITLNSIGTSYRLQGRVREALPYFEKALALYRAAGDRRHEAQSLNLLGICHGQLGDSAIALHLLQQAVGLMRATGDRRFEGIVLGNIGSVYALSSQPGKALEHNTQALSIFRAIGDRNYEATMLQAIAQAQRELGKLSEARLRAEAALSLIEEVRAAAGAEELRASYLASRQDVYAFTIDLLMELHGRNPSASLDATALNTSERSRARSLAEMLAESGAEVREGVDPKLLEREREISNLLNAKGSRLLPLMGRDTPQAAALKQEVRALQAEYQEVRAAIRKSSPHYAALTQPSPLTVKQIQDDLLDDDSLLLEYALGEKRSYLWVVSKNGLNVWELPARETIESQVEQVDDLLTARSVNKRMETPAQRKQRIEQADAALPQAARRLSEMVIGPAASVLGRKRLVVAPDGALQRLPFAMLPIPGSTEPLVASHEIVVLPSASALSVLRRELAGRKPAPKMLAIFADPVFDQSDPRAGRAGVAMAQAAPVESSRILEHLAEPGQGASAAPKIPRLPFTLQEAEQILQVARDPSNLKAFGFEASRAAATSGQLSQYRYVHFATHGYLDTERPSLSALVLSQIDENNQPLDGFLRVNDIYNTRLSAELVVLSACQTGLGKEVRGEGLMGLTRAFLYAGAPRVVVSLWNVNDRATASLMASLYRRMLRDGKRPPAALREAQLEVRKQKQWESPYYWAAFVQHGEWK